MKGKFMFNKKICIILSLLLVCIYFNLQIQAMANQHSPHPNLPTQVLYDKNITTKIDKNGSEIKDSKNITIKNRREALRFKITDSIEWYSSSEHIIKLLDISTKGLGVLTNDKLEIGEIVNFRILYEGLDINVDGKVVRYNDETKVCGLQFINMDPVTANCFLYINLVKQGRN